MPTVRTRQFALVAVALALALGAAVATALATPPAANGKIVFRGDLNADHSTSAAVAGAGSATQPFKVTSTLDGTSVLPHRIHWQAKANVRSASIEEIDFLIDGKVRWVEHKGPYFYGSDGDWLVTSFLSPGLHRFAVRVKTYDGRTATDLHAARVVKAGSVPSNLAGSWQRKIGADQAAANQAPAGTWHLRISAVGWSITDPQGGPSLIDIAYLSSTTLESRGPIWTTPAGPAGSLTEGNGWCDAPFPPVRYTYAVSGATLTLQLVGADRCGGEHIIWAGTWSRP